MCVLILVLISVLSQISAIIILLHYLLDVPSGWLYWFTLCNPPCVSVKKADYQQCNWFFFWGGGGEIFTLKRFGILLATPCTYAYLKTSFWRSSWTAQYFTTLTCLVASINLSTLPLNPDKYEEHKNSTNPNPWRKPRFLFPFFI